MKLIKISVVLLTLSLVGCISWVFAKGPFSEMPDGKYNIDLKHASIVWKVSHFGLSSYVARFADFDASIEYDPKNIANRKIRATIDPTSIQTAYPKEGEDDFDKELVTGSAWFNAGKFASINFTSTSIKMTGEKSAIMHGDLQFLGVTKPVSLDVIFNGAMAREPFSGKPIMGFSATTSIIRSQWGMSKFTPHVGDKVDIMIEGEFIKDE